MVQVFSGTSLSKNLIDGSTQNIDTGALTKDGKAFNGDIPKVHKTLSPMAIQVMN